MKEKQLTGYELSRQLFDFAFDRPECKAQHIALFFWIIELCNRLGWKKQFGLPTTASMEGLSIGDKRTFLSALRDLQSWGFVKIVQEAKNQFQACIIEICHSKITPAQTTALDTAMIRQNDSAPSGGTPINKPRNQETRKPKTNRESAGASPDEKVFLNKCFTKCIGVWKKHHTDWQIESKDGAAIKNIVKKINNWQIAAGKEVTPEMTAAAFDFIISHQVVKGSSFLSIAGPSILNGQLNSIYEQIKKEPNGTKQFFGNNRKGAYDPSQSIFAD